MPLGAGTSRGRGRRTRRRDRTRGAAGLAGARVRRHWAVQGGDRAPAPARPARPGLRSLHRPRQRRAGAALLVYLDVLTPGPRGLPDPARANVIVLAGLGAYLLVTVPTSVIGTVKGFAPVLRWLAEDRRATAEEQLAILRQPLDRSVAVFVRWAGAAVFFAVLLSVLGYPAT